MALTVQLTRMSQTACRVTRVRWHSLSPCARAHVSCVCVPSRPARQDVRELCRMRNDHTRVGFDLSPSARSDSLGPQCSLLCSQSTRHTSHTTDCGCGRDTRRRRRRETRYPSAQAYMSTGSPCLTRRRHHTRRGCTQHQKAQQPTTNAPLSKPACLTVSWSSGSASLSESSDTDTIERGSLGQPCDGVDEQRLRASGPWRAPLAGGPREV